MKILISNDDGYQAPGIVALHDALKTLDGVEVEVVAPEHNNSAKSNALTLHSPLYVHKAANGFRYVNGTPADCVHIALTGLLGYRPDLVVSGINNGANMGDDTIYSGTVGAAMELYDLGIITQEQIGVDAKFGSAEALCKLVEMTAHGEGFGKELAVGSARMCAKYGRPDLSMSVKSQEFPAYDSRGIQGIGLAYATSNRGACHLRGYTIASEVLGIPVKTDPHVTEGKAELVKAFQDATGVFDAAGICVFTSFAWTLADVQPQIQAACEGDWSMEKLNEVGERIWNMERQFNLAAGLTAKDDDLPPRLKTEAAKTGPAKGMVNGIDKMKPEYYKVRGWDTSGVPEKATLERLGL